MSFKRIFTCDKCGKEGENAKAIDLFAEVRVEVKTTQQYATHRAPVGYEAVQIKPADWCVKCCMDFGLIVKKGTFEPGQTTGEAIEELIREIVQEEMEP